MWMMVSACPEGDRAGIERDGSIRTLFLGEDENR